MDLWFLVDASNSVSERDFQRVKDFSTNLQNNFLENGSSVSTSNVRFGWSMYSFKHEVIFKFSDPQDHFASNISGVSRLLGK